MIILGIDPGTTSIGYALLEKKEGVLVLKECGLVKGGGLTESGLRNIHAQITNLIRQWKPAMLSVEKLFFAKNVKTAIAVAQVRGAILLTASLSQTRLCEYTPLEVKKAVTGHGRADKVEIEKILRMSVRGVGELRAKDDVFDAIAIALTAFLLENKTKVDLSR